MLDSVINSLQNNKVDQLSYITVDYEHLGVDAPAKNYAFVHSNSKPIKAVQEDKSQLEKRNQSLLKLQTTIARL